MQLSICIPTYNRAAHLANCLQSLISNQVRSKVKFQVCVSDNCSTDETENVVRRVQASIAIKYHKNLTNLGIPRNFLNAVAMADGEFVWLIGDDDLLLPFAIEQLSQLIEKYSSVDYFYVNSFHLTTQYVFSFPQPFDTANLPLTMEPFSSWPHSCEMKFMDLIDPRISFDFLGGMYLSVFRRKYWIANTQAIDGAAFVDNRVFSNFDNTFPHVKIFAKAFANSRAYFHGRPLSVCLSGAREWVSMYPLVRSVRLVEALDEYRENGLPYIKYLRCKNYALRNFIPDFAYMCIAGNSSGLAYVRPARLFISNCLYPNLYFSVFYYFARKIKAFLGKCVMF
ncbi:MAG: Abequosyltransferase RfbV [Nitrosomonadaceae bacterium]|nr:Abequosyltransferase RfbV [Nitrosomonadaceae bacterium]